MQWSMECLFMGSGHSKSNIFNKLFSCFLHPGFIRFTATDSLGIHHHPLRIGCSEQKVKIDPNHINPLFSGSINQWLDEFTFRNIKNIFTFSIIFLNVYGIDDIRDRGPFILHSPYHGFWWPGDKRSQAIISPAIDLVIMEYSKQKGWYTI